MTTGQRIKQRRIELGLTQEELAKRLGNKTRASVCTVEKDKEDLTTTRIRQYAEALETTPSYIMGWVDSPEVPHDISNEDRKLLDVYHALSPETRAAVDLLIKADQQKPYITIKALLSSFLINFFNLSNVLFFISIYSIYFIPFTPFTSTIVTP